MLYEPVTQVREYINYVKEIQNKTQQKLSTYYYRKVYFVDWQLDISYGYGVMTGGLRSG